MKALIKSGLFVALGWLTQSAGAQEIQWRAAPAKNPTPINNTDTGVRAVSMGLPTPLGDSTPQVVRAQAPTDKTIPEIPRLEVIFGGDEKGAKPLPKDKTFTPPSPTPVAPSPVMGSLGMDPDGFCGEWCGPRFGLGCCPDRPRFWGSAEYLMWWQRAQSAPALVTASPAGQVGNIGVLGVPSTTVLYDSVPNNMFSGGRFAAGMWFSRCCNWGIDTSFFFLGRQQNTAIFSSNGDPLLARPFFDAELGKQDAEIFTPGTVTIKTYSQLWGIEGNLRHKWRCGPNYWVDFFWGYRHLNLSEGIDITEDLTVPTGLGPLRIIEQESFRTRNQFNGLQAGLDGEWRFWNRFFVGWNTKFAMGSTHQILNIDGSTTFIAPAPIGTIVQPGALLATPTNIGHYTQNRFAVVPEIGVKLGVDLNDHWRIFAGYNFLYWSSVVRPGDQIDTNVAPSFRPTIFGPGVGGGPHVPVAPLRTSDYWAQGFSFGLMYRY
jgi:Putative beta barrel porin-7 (BBP7)